MQERDEEIAALQSLIDGAKRIVFFGGVGVSTESGIPDFRSEDGLYRQTFRFPPEYMLSHTCFEQHPEDFFAFYRSKMLAPDARPNAAHIALADWERKGKLSAVVTQNIDGLHQAAGSAKVLELHGSVHRNFCTRCGKFFPLEQVAEGAGVPRCDCGGTVKPDVVLYEEPLPERVWREAVREISEADMLIVAGTSLAVYPANLLLGYFRGGPLAIINLSPTPSDRNADLVICARVGETLSKIKL